MAARKDHANVFLNPGDFYFCEAGTRLHTLLGSCVAITLWHPKLRIGGMCHYLLPDRAFRTKNHKLDGRYADEAVQLFLLEVTRHNTRPKDYHVKIFGGGNMFPGRAKNHMEVGIRNIEMARRLLMESGFTLSVEDVGGAGHRKIIFDLRSGDVWVRQPKDHLVIKFAEK
jgi:chemotaxis protein CheD